MCEIVENSKPVLLELKRQIDAILENRQERQTELLNLIRQRLAQDTIMQAMVDEYNKICDQNLGYARWNPLKVCIAKRTYGARYVYSHEDIYEVLK